jgi:hypothetical protein
MSVLDNLVNLLRGSAKEFVDIPLEPAEQLILDKAGCLIKHGIVWKGGQLRLTDQRLLIRPWKTEDVSALLSWGLSKAGAPRLAVALVGKLQAENTAEGLDRDAIVSAGTGSGPSPLKPPTVTLTMADGRHIEIGVLSGPMTPNFSRGNVSHRDELLTAFQARIP